MIHQKPQKLKNLLETIRECISKDRYTLTTHAFIRQKERKISVSDIVHVLKTGYEEKRKTCFDNENNVWKYAIRGKTKIDRNDIRVIVTFMEEGEGMLIITVMYIEKL